MNIYQSGRVCVNGEFGGSINRALSDQWWSHVTVTRKVDLATGDTTLTLNLSSLQPSEKAKAKTLSLYFPETNKTVKRAVVEIIKNDTLSIKLKAKNGRYVNVLLLDDHSWIHYANTVVLLADRDAIYNDARVLSSTRAHLQQFQLDDTSVTMMLKLSEPLEGVSAFLQSVHGMVPVPVKTQGTNIALKYDQLQKLKPEMWMLLIADSEQKYLAQMCLTVSMSRIADTITEECVHADG